MGKEVVVAYWIEDIDENYEIPQDQESNPGRLEYKAGKFNYSTTTSNNNDIIVSYPVR
jgi:hypothetical protein